MTTQRYFSTREEAMANRPANATAKWAVCGYLGVDGREFYGWSGGAAVLGYQIAVAEGYLCEIREDKGSALARERAARLALEAELATLREMLNTRNGALPAAPGVAG